VLRADLPGAHVFRVTLESRVEYWEEEFVDGTRVRLGAPLTGNPVLASPGLPALLLLDENIRAAGRLPTFASSLGAARLSVHSQRRVTPLTLEFGLTDRIAFAVTAPLVRTHVRESFAFDSVGRGNLGLNPLLGDAGAAAAYATFFSEFDAALTAAACPDVPSCPPGFLSEARAAHDARRRTVYGTGTGGGAPFLPVAGSDGAVAVDSEIARIQAEFRATYGDSSFATAFLFPADTIDATDFNTALTDPTLGFGSLPFEDTPERQRFWLGDIELGARFQAVRTPAYVATVGLIWRLGTGHVADPGDPFALSAGDGQTDLEGQLVQELTLWRRLWLNLSVKGALQRPAERERRVAPAAALLVRPQLTAPLTWDPGDWLAVDFAPMYRFHPSFAAGVTFGYFTSGEDRHTYRTAQDSIDLATRVGAAVPASLLDGGTATRRTRAGIAASFVGPVFETGFSAERTISGAAGRVPAAWTFRLVLRGKRKLF
jgi:hypothetical protein